MDSREILPETERIQFLLDTSSLDSLTETKYSTLEKFLRYSNHDSFRFLRTPEKAEHDLLQDILPLQIEKNSEANKQIIRWGSENGGIHAARYMPEIYERWVGETDWNEPVVSVAELELTDLFSELVHRRDDFVDILVTSNDSILNNRRLLEYQIRRHKEGRMHIMAPSEASELAGIFMRRNDDFIFYMPETGVSSYEIDFTLWYWTLPRVFVQHFTADEKGYLGSMLDRLESLLIGIDKLGVQYYRGTGNHTDLLTRYHFNNGISLITGICDVLALHTKDKYDIDILDENTNLRTGNHPLLKELQDYNPEAWEYVHENHEVIELLHTVRNDIIHQNGVIKRGPGFSFQEHSETTVWRSQTLWMEELDESDRDKFRKYYEQLDDVVEEYDPVTKWGVVTEFDDPPEIYEHTQIEPYRFLKQATKEIAQFADEYLRLLNHPNRVQDSSDKGPASKSDVRRIVEYGLHPFLNDIDPDPL